MLKGLRKRLAIIFTVFTGAVLTAALAASFYQSVQQTRENRDWWFSSTVDRVASTVMNNSMSGEQTSLYEGGYIVCAKENGQVLEDFLVEANEDTAVKAISQEDRLAMFEQAKTIAEEEGLADWITESYQVFAMQGVAAATADDVALELRPSTEGMAYAEGSALFSGGSVAIAISPVVGTEGVFNMDYAGTQYRATYFSWEFQQQGDAKQNVYEVAVLEDLAGQTQEILLNGLWYALVLLAGLGLLFLANWFLARLVLRPTEDGLRRQTEFVAAASHELRSPLAVIRASLSAAAEAKDKRQKEKFETAAAEEAERMSHLVDDLLLLAGGDAGSWQLQSAPVDVDTLLIDAAESYAPLAKEKQVQLQLDLPGETLPRVQGDAERLRQILAVLLDNALQYAPADTQVKLAAAAKKGKVYITVADRGRGIADEEKDKVFERFYRADKSRHEKAHFGLGLSVARELAELHGGKITLADTKDGGATFTLVLPASSVPEK